MKEKIWEVALTEKEQFDKRGTASYNTGYVQVKAKTIAEAVRKAMKGGDFPVVATRAKLIAVVEA